MAGAPLYYIENWIFVNWEEFGMIRPFSDKDGSRRRERDR
jgi:hypothetical protein